MRHKAWSLRTRARLRRRTEDGEALPEARRPRRGTLEGVTPVASLAPVLTPHGQLRLVPADDAAALPADLAERLATSFARGSGHGLLQLGASETGTALPPAFGYWREIGSRYMSAACGRPMPPDSRDHAPVPPPPDGELEMFAAAAPPMAGAEYLDGSVLHALWDALDAAFASATRPGTWSAACTSTSPRTGATPRRRSPFSPPTRRGCRRRPRRSTCRSARRSRVRRRRQQGAAAVAAAAGAARRRSVSLAEGDGRVGRDLPPAALDAGRGLAAAATCPARGRRRRRARAGHWRASRPPRPQVTATVGGKPPSGSARTRCSTSAWR
jgi:hypothetical protein